MSTQEIPLLHSSPIVAITLIRDISTPSGVRLVVPDGSFDLQIRYCHQKISGSFFFAYNLLDLVAQNTPGASGLNGKSLVMDRWVLLQTSLVQHLLFGKAKWRSNKRIIEDELSILIAEGL